MLRSSFLMSTLVAAGLVVHAGEARAVLPPDLTSGLEARGQVDVDAFGPTPPLSNLVQQELTLPFTRSAVGVADAQAGVFDYAASADIGTTPALRVSGSIANSGSSAFFGQGMPVLGAPLNAAAQAVAI
jgi:hypothetical protein